MIKELNIKQKEELNKLIGFYKHIYVCNNCGRVYGTDLKEEKNRLCPYCFKDNSVKLKKRDNKQ